MENQRKSFYEEMKAGGMTRKDFLKFCTSMAALLGLEASGVGQIVKALETKPRLPVIWFHFQEGSDAFPRCHGVHGKDERNRRGGNRTRNQAFRRLFQLQQYIWRQGARGDLAREHR